MITKKKTGKQTPCETHNHPDHNKEAVRLKRVIGQLEGIKKMIEDRRYCPDILIQVRAAKSAIAAVEMSILKTHLESCVADAISEKDEKKASLKVNELVELLARHK